MTTWFQFWLQAVLAVWCHPVLQHQMDPSFSKLEFVCDGREWELEYSNCGIEATCWEAVGHIQPLTKVLADVLLGSLNPWKRNIADLLGLQEADQEAMLEAQCLDLSRKLSLLNGVDVIQDSYLYLICSAPVDKHYIPSGLVYGRLTSWELCTQFTILITYLVVTSPLANHATAPVAVKQSHEMQSKVIIYLC